MSRLLIRFLRDIRLVPIVVVAIACLFALKSLGLVLNGGYLFDAPASQTEDDDGDVTGMIGPSARTAAPLSAAPAATNKSWAQQMFNFPDVTGAVDPPPVPSKAAAPSAAAEAGAKKKPQEPPPSVDGIPVPLDNERPVSPAERKILESLQKRRDELEARSRELDIREDLVKAAEKRLEGRVIELKDLEARVNALLQQKDDADAARFKNVVSMYESMKAKDAAKIFDGLDIKVLLEVAKAINPRNMSDILAQMQPATAQRLTAELSARSDSNDGAQTADLPKISGQPTPN